MKSSPDLTRRAKPADHAEKHRTDMRGKLLGKGSAALTELEILEMLLYTGAKRGGTKPLPKQLIKTLKSLSAVIVIALHDNLIVAGASCVSFKSLEHR